MSLTRVYGGEKPPLPEPVESLRERIPGWGVDLDPADRPSYPREDTGLRLEGAAEGIPEQQPVHGYRERSIEHADLTPVFGTAQPLKGPAGAIRRLAYERFSEGRAVHWLLLMAGDRVDTLTSTLGSFASTRPDNLLTETGIRSELSHHGLRSRRGRVDARHHVLDPLIVAGPWVVAAVPAVKLVRRGVRAVARRGSLNRSAR